MSCGWAEPLPVKGFCALRNRLFRKPSCPQQAFPFPWPETGPWGGGCQAAHVVGTNQP